MRRHQPYRHSGWPDRSTMMTMTLRRINRLTNKWSATVNITDAVGKSFLITFKTGFVCLSNEPILFSIFLLMSNDIKAINSDAGHSLSGYEPRTALLHNECIESDRRHPFALFHQHPSDFCHTSRLSLDNPFDPMFLCVFIKRNYVRLLCWHPIRIITASAWSIATFACLFGYVMILNRHNHAGPRTRITHAIIAL